jgi:hypothetical protein
MFATQGATESETVVVERLPGTRTVMGIECIRIRDRAYVSGVLAEDTEDWYAQDDAGNVWYMGEAVVAYEYDDNGVLTGTSTEGSWEAGLDPLNTGTVAQPGFAIPAHPTVGQIYYQEFYEEEAEDIGEVVAVDVPVVLADGTSYTCVKTRDTSSLDTSTVEFKYYAPGVGIVLEETPGVAGALQYRGRFVTNASSQPTFTAGNFSAPAQIDHPLFPTAVGTARTYVGSGPDGIETTVVERLAGTRVVMGIACARVRDRVYADGLLQEDTEDWFAEDDEGNVWYMGEDVTNYAYDDNGVLTGTNHGGSWEAGLDIASTGSIASPGHQLPAVPTPGSVYYQEFYPGAAEDMGLVVSVNVTAHDLHGSAHMNCARVMDWNPLHVGQIEYKEYAPGVGLVREEALHEHESASLAGTFVQGAASIPNFAGATFTMSTLVDNPLNPLPVGATWSHESETSEGTETNEIQVLPQTRVVAGVTCVVVRDRSFLDGVLIEDTEDWLAQDNAGNVWYFGEDVTNYVYDSSGVLTGTNHDGSWEAGLDLAGVGAPAKPGIQMWAQPIAGTSYYQEFYPGAAEDMGRVVATNVALHTAGGVNYTGCVKVLDWNPLHPDGLEAKYYAPGIGLVYEEVLHEGAHVELTDTSL